MDYYGLEKEDVMLLGELDKDDAAFIDKYVKKFIDDGNETTANKETASKVIDNINKSHAGYVTDENEMYIGIYIIYCLEKYNEPKKEIDVEEVNKTLNRKFKHNTWYKNAHLTVKEFLELAAESSDMYLSQKEARVQSSNMFDDTIFDNVLMDEESRGFYRLNEIELEYYKKRKTFWTNWNKKYTERYYSDSVDYYEYCHIKNIAKLSVAQYKIAYDKFAASLSK